MAFQSKGEVEYLTPWGWFLDFFDRNVLEETPRLSMVSGKVNSWNSHAMQVNEWTVHIHNKVRWSPTRRRDQTRNNEWKLEDLETVIVQWSWRRQIWKKSLGDCDGNNVLLRCCILVIRYHWEENEHYVMREDRWEQRGYSLHGVLFGWRSEWRYWEWEGVWLCAEAEKTQHKLRGHFCHFVG